MYTAAISGYKGIWVVCLTTYLTTYLFNDRVFFNDREFDAGFQEIGPLEALSSSLMGGFLH